MRKLTINAKPIVIWMETQADADLALKTYSELCFRDYVGAVDVEAVRTAVSCGLVPVISCPIEDMIQLLDREQPVLFCIEKFQHKVQGGDNPLKQKLYQWRMIYTGLVAFGESPSLYGGERSVWGIPHHHSMNFEAFGYS